MPPLPKVRLPALADLLAQLRFAPTEALVRNIEAAESLVQDVDAASDYPLDWLVYRLTRFRPDKASTSTVPGQRILAELGPFVETLSARALLRREDHPGWPDDRTLARAWGVSAKTIMRFRRQGLIARRVRSANARPVLIVEPSLASWYRQHRVGEDRNYSRISASERDRILRRARRYRSRLGCSLNQAASRLARRFSRSHEAIRQLLKRHDQSESDPIFRHQGPLNDATGRSFLTAWREGHSPEKLAKAHSRRPPAVIRAINTARAQFLRSLSLEAGDAPETIDDLLRTPAVTQDLWCPPPRTIGEWQALARSTPPPALAAEHARVRAMRALTARAAAAITALPHSGAPSPKLDAIETDLRWAMRLRTLLIRSQWGLMLRSIESAAQEPLDRLPPALATALVKSAHEAVADACVRLDPDHGGRLAGASAVALQRVIALELKRRALAKSDPATTRRATPLVAPSMELPGQMWRTLVPWQDALDAPSQVLHTIEQPPGQPTKLVRDLIVRRFGLAGPPLTVRAMAELLKAPEPVTARRLQIAIRTAFAAPPALHGGPGAPDAP